MPKMVVLLSLFILLSHSLNAEHHVRTKHKYIGHIDPKSLNSGLASPTITGTFSGEGGVGIVIVKGMATLPKKGDFSSLKNSVVVGYSDHGGDVDVNYANSDSIWNGGTFSYHVSDTLQPGSYTVGVYVYYDIYTKDGFQGISTSRRVAIATFAIR